MPLPIIKVIGAFLKGAVRAFPLGNAIIKGAEAANGGPVKTIVTDGGAVITGQVKDPNVWLKIIVEVAGVGVLVYLIVTGKIDVDKFIELLRGL